MVDMPSNQTKPNRLKIGLDGFGKFITRKKKILNNSILLSVPNWQVELFCTFLDVIAFMNHSPRLPGLLSILSANFFIFDFLLIHVFDISRLYNATNSFDTHLIHQNVLAVYKP